MARFYELKITDNKSVKLRMNVGDVINLEKALGGKNPLSIFSAMSGSNDDMGGLPTFKDILLVLHYSLQGMEHGYDIKKSEALMNEYLDYEETGSDGEPIYRSYTDLIPILLEVFQVSGIIPKTSMKVDPNRVIENMVESPNA